MQSEDILSLVYPARITAVESLRTAVAPHTNNAEQLRQAANALDQTGPLYGRATTAAIYAAFADLLRAVAHLAEWRHAILHAESDADRFLRAARARAQQWLGEFEATESMALLCATARAITEVVGEGEVGSVCHRLATTPLPIGVFSEPERHFPRLPDSAIEVEAKEVPEDLAIAFLRFQIDGSLASETHFLTPNELHDLEIEVRVSRWPDHAAELVLTPVSIEPQSSYDFPVFRLGRPVGEAPHKLAGTGRAVLKTPQGLNARPYEFKYAAAFTPAHIEQPVAVVGQRTLRIEGFDLTRNPMTGYASIDRKLLLIRDSVRRQSWILPTDLDSLLTVLRPFCNLAGRTVQDALFKGISNESGFQSAVRDELRRDPHIGSKMDEHPWSAGGITDLSFNGIRIELKYSNDHPLSVSDCLQFAGQTIAYVVGTGKRVGILCVLDNSPKVAPAFPADEGIVLYSHQTNEGTVDVVVVLLQGGLPKPSSLSR